MELKKLDMDDIKRRILYGLIILSLLPLITMFYINLKQDKWETDRNFYGKESSEDQLKITQNTYQKYECSSKKITKKKELGNMRYYYRDKNHINFEAMECKIIARRLLMPKQEFLDQIKKNEDVSGRVNLTNIARHFCVDESVVSSLGVDLNLLSIF